MKTEKTIENLPGCEQLGRLRVAWERYNGYWHKDEQVDQWLDGCLQNDRPGRLPPGYLEGGRQAPKRKGDARSGQGGFGGL